MIDTLLDAALQYAELGYAVFPCVPGGKPPITNGGFKDATTDVTQIESWWTAAPNANIGLYCDGLVVIDVDVDENGNRNSWLVNQPLQLAELNAAPMSMTPRGGRHYFFKRPAERDDELRAVVAAVDALPAEMALVIRSVYLNGKPLTSIANRMGVPHSTLRSRFERAIECLRRQLSGVKTVRASSPDESETRRITTLISKLRGARRAA